ncbi:MAG: hypothetical protein WD941_01265 [Opitutus sp.]
MEPIETRTRWIAAGAGAVVIMGLLLSLFRAPDGATIPAPSADPSLAIADLRATDPAAREAAQIYDLAPLFLPTDHNAKLNEVPRPEPGRGVFDVEPTKLSFPESGLQFGQALPPVVTLNGRPMAAATPADAMTTTGAGPSLAGFGRREAPVAPLPLRGGFIEVVAAGTGECILAEILPLEARPATGSLWQPPQFLAVLDASGLIGPLRVTESSRVEEVDRHYQNYLTQTFRLGERLAAGFYRVTVGP